ncbi:MAG: dihydroneopterin aldolase [Limnochordia bacterium]|jgi:dihydroneopterin aldolase|nr:dihydroneopterin aldolase [Limnochordia bacterium]MDD2628739.1 dihydroneopterin aldolase [Limnochordia bacterium]MDD4517175.1 dihydroneopterin aldolase [Limnochordia bacterium]
MASDRIRLNNMVFYGYHGAFAAERELGQRVEVDLELDLDLQNTGRTDDPELSVNYVDIYTIVKELVEEGEYNLLEALAESIADTVLGALSVDGVVVRVRKPQPPVGGLMSSVEVEIVRSSKDPELIL